MEEKDFPKRVLMGHPSALQWRLPFLPTRTCCSPRTPCQMPTSPQSPSQGHAPWAIHTPGGFSKLSGMLLLLPPARNLWWCFGKLLVPAPHEVVSVCCAVAWRERLFWYTCVSGTTHHQDSIRRHWRHSHTPCHQCLELGFFGRHSSQIRCPEFLLRKKWRKATLHVHPSWPGPRAILTPLGQQPNSCVLQGHPWGIKSDWQIPSFTFPSGPGEGVNLSGQQPFSVE